MTPTRSRQYLYSVAIVVAASALCLAVSEFLGYRVIALILLLVVSLLAINFEILPVLLSATLTAFIWDFFFIPPRYTIHVDTMEDAILLTMYFVIAMISAVLTYRIRKAEKAANLKEEKANSVKLYNTILDSLSHELRTPIAAIIAAADNLQGNPDLSKKSQDQLIGEISKASLRLNQQVENLLSISRLESGHIKPKNDWCDLIELVYEVAKHVEESNPGRRINININPSFPLCRVDKGMLEQVVYNLLNNAAVHTDPSCRIDVSASCHGDLLQIIIEDSGKGFRETDLRHVFDKFSRSRREAASGSGLGLSIVKGFTEALGGSVTLQNVPQGGARFTISIPVETTSIKIPEP